MEPLTGSLLQLVSNLDGLGPEPSLVSVVNAVQGVNLTSADVADYIQPNLRNYNRIPVVVRDAYELLVLTWLPGQSSLPHCHFGSVCVMRVVQGKAVEGCYRIAKDGYVDIEYETEVACNGVIAGQDAGVHTIRNPSLTDELLVTVHVYVPRLMDFRQFKTRPNPIFRGTQVGVAPSSTVVIIGGGFSGSMAAAQTLRRARQSGTSIKVVLVERRGAIGEGIAYGTREAAHLLNVPAGRMSAWPDRPNDFVAWANRRYGNVGPGDFLPRMWYGEYIRESVLAAAQEAQDSTELIVIFDEVRRIARHPDNGWMVHLAWEPSLRANALVLAIGHRPPLDPIGHCWSGPRTRFISDPWRPFAMNVVAPDETVVILGSGLTAVDTVLSLTQQPRQAPIILVSRNGLLPEAHAKEPKPAIPMTEMIDSLLAEPGGVQARTIFQMLRRKVKECGDWRTVVDGLRPHTATIWRAMPLDQRKKFLARLRPFWEVHRHRMATSIAENLDGLMDRGEVKLLPGRVESVIAEDNRLRLTIRESRSGKSEEIFTSWVINCTGPVASNCVESNPVIGSLLVGGWLRPDKLSLGIETSIAGNAIAADGQPVENLFLVGTLRKPAFWESTAVPELRVQAADVSERVLSFLVSQLQPVAAG